jgi:2-haloacid dehalogenase
MIAVQNLILMDVYGTIIDMSEMEKRVNVLLNSKRGYAIWFELFMGYCFVDNCTGQFNDFVTIGKATLQMAAKKLNVLLNDEERNDILELLKHLPIRVEVQEGLSRLRDLGFRIAALTNAPGKIVKERMERTGLISYFDEVLSAEQVRKYKPCSEVYLWAVQKFEVEPGQALLVSSHGWDIAGASSAQLQTAYVQQNRELIYPLTPKPNYITTGLLDLSYQLEALKSQVH